MRESNRQIIIEDLRVLAAIGCTEEERQHPQHLSISLIFYLSDLPENQTGETIQLQDTVNYQIVCDTVQTLLKAKAWELIEHVASAVGRETLQLFSKQAQAVTVKVKKFIIPDVAFTAAQTTIHR